MKTGEQGKWGPQLIYSISSYNEKPGVWLAVIFVSLSFYQLKAKELCHKDGLLTHHGIYLIIFALKKFVVLSSFVPVLVSNYISCTCNNFIVVKVSVKA